MKGPDWGLVRRLLPYLRQRVGLVVGAFVLLLGMDFLSILHPYLVKIAIDEHVMNGDLPGLIRVGMILAGVLVAYFVTQVLFNYAIEYLGQRLIFEVRMDVFRKILSLGNDYFDTTPVGKTLAHVTNDVEAIREFISSGIVVIVGDVLKVVFILAAMLLINPRLALLVFVTLPVSVGATLVFRTGMRTGFRGVRAANAEINTALVETITGIKEIAVFANKRVNARRFDRSNQHYLTSYLGVVHSFSVFMPVIELVAYADMLGILLFSHFALGVTVQVGEVFAFFSYINMFFRPLRELAERFNSFQSAMAASERIFTLLDLTPSIVDPPVPEGATAEASETGVRGTVELRDVHFAYKEDTPVFGGLSFRVEAGEKVALVGSTGAGKSTIINLLNRLYPLGEGVIEVDGVDITALPLADLRRRITTVPQDFFLFSGTVAENIALFDPGITRDRVEAAARAVNVDGFVRSLPQGYDQEVLEEGRSFSTGQKQLLSFARAFVTRPSIVLIDEATSSVDSHTEKLIEEGLLALLEGRTAIIIAHRLSTIRNVDRILVLHRGALVEEGTHAELMRRTGVYHQLYRTQAIG